MDLALTAEADTFAEHTAHLDRGVGIRVYCIALEAAVCSKRQ